MPEEPKLAKRESELMEAIFTLGEASASDIENQLVNPPSNAAIRTHLSILVEKGHLKFRKEGRRFIYTPTTSRAIAGSNALKNTLKTFFDGSLSHAVAGLLSNTDTQLSDDDIQRLEYLIQKSKKN